ncbi:inositol monophosphatase family protein [Neptunomonas qingdaonensis]|uniref:Myo-inositol-1(Or 4)-monophosphatase n=1 Tax=Neptunomonas qingdaonensis TaxID=1045558 RepID=A0A1I2UBF1_9GAMM|nr:inositol monophosphatase family protein [Neptunomonas qingdaonensis]SFG74454.1 myo-inositol-1(or 4)-monophosphatase [Neptunomonas qingdaonensis]
MQPMLNIALRAARIAGEQIARSAERIDLIKSEQSSISDFLNETATKAEQTIAYSIQKAYPAHTLIGEFSGVHKSLEENTDVTWHINPIDSVSNFSNGLPVFAICMSAEMKGRIEHAVILNPINGEEFTASRGNGAHLNGKRLRVSNKRLLEQTIIGSSFLNSASEKAQFETFKQILCQLQSANAIFHNSGSAALNMAYTAAGRLDGFIQIKIDPQILNAGALIIQEAGGLLGDFKGSNDFRKNGNTVAANPKLFKALLKAIRQSSED